MLKTALPLNFAHNSPFVCLSFILRLCYTIIVQTWIVSVTNKYSKYHRVVLSSFGETDHLTVIWLKRETNFKPLLDLKVQANECPFCSRANYLPKFETVLVVVGRCRARQALHPRRVCQRHQTTSRRRTLSNRNLCQTARSRCNPRVEQTDDGRTGKIWTV